MLVLSRFRSEAVVITMPDGRRVVVTVEGVRGSGQVRLGFAAPEDVDINRDEVQAVLDREGRAK